MCNEHTSTWRAKMIRVSKLGSAALISATAAITLFWAAASAADRHTQEEDRPTKIGNGPGPGPLGPGPGCNLVPPIASVGTVADITEFPPPDSVAVDPRLQGPVQLLRSGQIDIPIETLTRADVPDGARGTITMPLYKGAVNTPSGLRPAWYIITDASTQDEADRLGVNVAVKLRNAGDAARPATFRDD